ncbi:hypothetical protein DOFOFD_11990 [Acetobacteraceae bacterium EV16P]|uniref:NAD-dependent epimerase/dehydratase domain-containing protein n=1 Tax=Sorlinia euscelidii TaxID=3081148 RepID=A0ABU7U4R7_9PROT
MFTLHLGGGAGTRLKRASGRSGHCSNNNRFAGKNLLILLTGGCGFIGSSVVRHFIQSTGHSVVNVDCMTYAATEDSVGPAASNPVIGMKNSISLMQRTGSRFSTYQPDAVMHLARRVTSIAQSMGRAPLSKPISSALLHYWKPRGATGSNLIPPAEEFPLSSHLNG